MAAKEPGVLRFKFHKISASELPLDNPTGNMQEVILALKNQLRIVINIRVNLRQSICWSQCEA